MASDGGKGSTPRPYSVPRKEFENNWDKIFGKKDEQKDSKNQQEDAKL
jgi:hypothetical protein